MTTNAEWQKRRPLDREGIALLGAMLCLRWKNSITSARRALNSEWDPDDPLALDQLGRDRLNKQIEMSLRDIDRVNTKIETIWPGDPTLFDVAENLHLKDIRFSWQDLYQHQALLPNVIENLPDWYCGGHPGPLEVGNPVLHAMEAIFTNGTQWFLSGKKGVFVSALVPPRNVDSQYYSNAGFYFSLLVSDLCEPPKPAHRPKGSSTQGLEEDAALETAIYALHLKDMNPRLSRADAVSLAFNDLGIEIRQTGRDSAPNVIFSNADEQNKLPSAKARVRRLLDHYLTENQEQERRFGKRDDNCDIGKSPFSCPWEIFD